MKLFSRKTKPVLVAKMCSACGESLAEHTQLDLASAPIGSEDEARLAALVTERNWPEASQYHAANALTDIRVWRMIRCRDGRVGVVPLVMPIEMWSDDYYEEPQFLINAEGDELLAALSSH